MGVARRTGPGRTAPTHPRHKVRHAVDDELSPLQREIIDSLGVPPDWEPLPDSLVLDLETMLTAELAPIDGMFSADDPLRVNKHFLGTVHGCEKHFLVNRDKPFAWTVPMVRGTVAHKAIELMINWNAPVVPSELVDAAITSIVENPRESAAAFLETLPAHDLAELRGQTVQLVTNFGDCFPPIKPQWRPMVEYSAKYSLLSGSVLLTSRMDLVLGAPGRRVIIDLKSGYIGPSHRDDLRFYALVESLRSRRTPRRLGTYSLETARLDHEEVTEGVLQAAVRRTARGILLMADLVGKTREPDVRPGNQCRWCPLNDSCDEGARFLKSLSGDDTDEW